jgi:hypothetical protein
MRKGYILSTAGLPSGVRAATPTQTRSQSRLLQCSRSHARSAAVRFTGIGGRNWSGEAGARDEEGEEEEEVEVECGREDRWCWRRRRRHRAPMPKPRKPADEDVVVEVASMVWLEHSPAFVRHSDSPRV